jgi:hypothetical protein
MNPTELVQKVVEEMNEASEAEVRTKAKGIIQAIVACQKTIREAQQLIEKHKSDLAKLTVSTISASDIL